MKINLTPFIFLVVAWMMLCDLGKVAASIFLIHSALGCLIELARLNKNVEDAAGDLVPPGSPGARPHG